MIPHCQQSVEQNVKDGLRILERVGLSSLKFWWAAISYSIFKTEKELYYRLSSGPQSEILKTVLTSKLLSVGWEQG